MGSGNRSKHLHVTRATVNSMPLFSPFLPSLRKCLSSTYYMQGTVLGANTETSKAVTVLQEPHRYQERLCISLKIYTLKHKIQSKERARTQEAQRHLEHRSAKTSQTWHMNEISKDEWAFLQEVRERGHCRQKKWFKDKRHKSRRTQREDEWSVY